MTRKSPLGGKSVERDVKSIRVLANLAPVTPTTPTDHGTLSGLADDDHSHYVHISSGRTITAQHSFAPGAAQAPFSLGANAQSQLVTGLRADEVNKEIAVSGLGLSGGGILTTNRTITLTSSSNPGAAAAVLASDANGGLFLDTSLLAVDAANDKVGIKDAGPYYDLDVNGTIRGTAYRIGTGDPATSYLGLTGSDVILYANSGTIEASPILKLRYDATYVTSLTTNASGNFIVAPYADFVFDPGGKDIMPNTAYDLNIGALNKKYLTLHAAELWVETLVAQDTLATIGGRVLIGPTTILAEDLAAVQTYMTVKHNQMARNDTCYLEANSKVEFILVGGRAITEANQASDYFKIFGNFETLFEAGDSLVVIESTGNNGTYTVASASNSGSDTLVYVDEEIPNATADGYLLSTGIAGAYTYLSVTRNRDGSGANDWYAGDAVFNTGTTGDGFIDLYSIGSVKGGTQYGPTIVGNVRSSTTYNDWVEHWAIGNLNGLYGFGSNEFGIGLGKYSGANYVTIDSTNGIRFFDTDDIVRAQLTGTSWTIGRTGYYKTVITDSAWTMYKNTDDRTFIVNTNGVFMGDYTDTEANRSYVYIDTSGNMKFIRGADINIQLYSTGSAAFGRVATSHANAFWNESNDRLEFRGGTNGTVVQSYIDTDGSFVNGTDDVVINNSGVSINASNIGGNVGKITFPGQYGDIGYVEAYQGSAINNYFSLEAKTHNSISSDLVLIASGEIRSEAPKMVINQAGIDTAIIELQSSDVTHAMTDYFDTNTYGAFQKTTATGGGLWIRGLSDTDANAYAALQLQGINGVAADTTKSASGYGVIRMLSYVKSGAGATTVGSDGNLVSIGNGTSTRFIFDAEGDLHVDGSSTLTTYDKYDDLSLIRGLEMNLTAKQIDSAFKSWLDSQREKLIELGILSNGGFINATRLQRLQNGALWQLHERLERLERRLLDARE